MITDKYYKLYNASSVRGKYELEIPKSRYSI